MLADLPEHYTENGKPHPALQFIRDVGVDWSESHVLNGEVGEFVTIARKERGTGNWFVGGITNEEGRSETIVLDFLEPGKTYEAILYQDGANAHWDTNPLSYDIKTMEVSNTDTVEVILAPGGGFALSLKEK